MIFTDQSAHFDTPHIYTIVDMLKQITFQGN